jgi:uncharacterized repeat protein (TIGR02543 family)
VPDARTEKSGTVITLPKPPGNPVKPGYEFTGWNTAANGTGILYKVGSDYLVTESVTLYANWESVIPVVPGEPDDYDPEFP